RVGAIVGWVGGAMTGSAGCRRRWSETSWLTISQKLRRLPTVQPMLARQQALAAQQAHGEIAQGGFRPAQPIEPALPARGALRARGAVAARAFIGAQRTGGIVTVARQHVGEHGGILD